MKLSHWLIHLKATQDLRDLPNGNFLLKERKVSLSPFYTGIMEPGRLKVFLRSDSTQGFLFFSVFFFFQILFWYTVLLSSRSFLPQYLGWVLTRVDFMHYIFFWFWLLSFKIMFVRFIHIFPCRCWLFIVIAVYIHLC